MYILIEMQTNESTAIVPAKTFTDRLQAESAFYTALAAAAVSSVRVHTVLLVDEHGKVIRQDCYEHLTEA